LFFDLSKSHPSADRFGFDVLYASSHSSTAAARRLGCALQQSVENAWE
jgi:hypothetical protein